MSFLENISDECQFHQHTSDEWHRQYHYIDLVELYIAFINFIFGLTFNLLFFFLYIHLIQKKRSEIINEYHERYMNISNKIKRYQKKVLKCQRSSDIELISTKTLEDDISHQRISIRWSDEKKEDFTQNNFITSIDYDRKTTNVFDNLLRNDFRIFTSRYSFNLFIYYMMTIRYLSSIFIIIHLHLPEMISLCMNWKDDLTDYHIIDKYFYTDILCNLRTFHLFFNIRLIIFCEMFMNIKRIYIYIKKKRKHFHRSIKSHKFFYGKSSFCRWFIYIFSRHPFYTPFIVILFLSSITTIHYLPFELPQNFCIYSNQSSLTRHILTNNSHFKFLMKNYLSSVEFYLFYLIPIILAIISILILIVDIRQTKNNRKSSKFLKKFQNIHVNISKYLLVRNIIFIFLTFPYYLYMEFLIYIKLSIVKLEIFHHYILPFLKLSASSYFSYIFILDIFTFPEIRRLFRKFTRSFFRGRRVQTFELNT